MSGRKIKTYTLEEMVDKHIGKQGTTERDKFEHDLRMDLIGDAIREARKKRGLTQEQLGDRVGVKKAQISKLENSLTNARLETIIKVFRALEAKINFNVVMENEKIRLAS